MTIETLLLSADHESDLEHAAMLLKAGKLVAIPTETVYGLAASAHNDSAIQAVFAAKNRPSDHPLILHIGQIEQLSAWVANIPAAAEQLAKHCWPGPLTMILAKAPGVSPLITGGRDTIAVRMPDHARVRQLLSISGPVVAPSANLHKKISPTCAQQVMDGLTGRIDAVLDGGDCQLGLESTIIDLTRHPVQVLRAGPFYPQHLADIIGQDVFLPTQHNIAVAGNMLAHYQPDTQASLFTSNELMEKLSSAAQNTSSVVVIHFSELSINKPIHGIKMASQRQKYASQLYQALAQADSLHCQEIWIEQPPAQWHEVIDRLSRACFR